MVHHPLTTAEGSSQLFSSSNTSSHNPYGSRFLPLDSSNFLPEELRPGGSMTYSEEYEDNYYQNDDDNDDDDDDDNEEVDDDNYQETSHQHGHQLHGQGTDISTTTESSALVQPAPDPLPEPHIINQPMNHNTPPFTFGAQVDMINPKLLHEVLMSPVPQGKKFMCRIVRKNEGIDKRIYPTYELSLEEPSRPQRIFLLRATKKKRSRGSYYAITSEPEFTYDYDRKASDENYGVLGKLRSNFLGTAFNVYSNGRNPFSSGEHNGDGAHDQQSLSPMEKEKQRLRRENSGKNMTVRQELGAVIYNPNVLGLKGPRKMTILMNTMTAEGDVVERRPTHVKDTLISRMTDGDMADLLVLRNKSPQWNDETNSFVLNFGGRVSLASVKNFQIVHDNDLDYIIMQFGRTSQDNFTMDCQYPMTPFQAFAFALTSFDAKLACE